MTTKRNGVFVVVAVILALLSSASAASAQSTKRYEFGRDSRTKQILFIKNKKAYTPRYERGLTLKSGVQTLAAAPYQSLTDSTIKTDPVLAADKFLRSNASKFGVSAGSLYPQKVEIDNLGMAHVRYQQRYRDIPVFGGGLIVHVGANNIVTAANGRVARRISAYVPSERLRLSEDEVREIARNFWFAEYGREVTPVVEVRGSYIYSPTFLGTVNYSVNATPSPTASASPRPSASPYGSSTPVPTSTPRVSSRLSYGDYVYRVVAHSEETHNAQIYFVDGRTGELRGRESGVHGITRGVLDCSASTIFCRMDSYSSSYQYTFGRSEGQPARGACPVPPFTGTTDTDFAYDALGAIHSFYVNVLGRDGANGTGGLGYGAGIAWPGTAWTAATAAYTYIDKLSPYSATCPLAGTGFNTANGSLGFCRGVAVADVIAHEYSHGLPFYAHVDGSGSPVGMVYSGESGALMESQADVFAELIERNLSGGTNWKFGETSINGLYRDLSYPPRSTFYRNAGFPDRTHSLLVYCGEDDHNGVHYNSTILSYAFYLLANGGRFNGCSVVPVAHDAIAKILYRAVTQYYSTTESFNGAYNNLLQACSDLFPTGNICNSLMVALQAVELDQAGTCSGIPGQLPACATAEPECVDSDGDNPSVYGVVNFDSRALADRCGSDRLLSEAVCINGIATVTQHACANGCVRANGAHCE